MDTRVRTTDQTIGSQATERRALLRRSGVLRLGSALQLTRNGRGTATEGNHGHSAGIELGSGLTLRRQTLRRP